MNHCALVFLLAAVLVGTACAQHCWQKSYKREVHTKDSCPDGWDNYIDDCYGPCPATHKPYHDICYQNVTCKEPLIEAGESCLKPASYSRPSYPLFEQEECERNHQDVGCELVGPLWMPKCKANYHGVFTECVYSCPPEYEDELTHCFKPHIPRPSQSHICPPGTTEDAPGEDFCYAPCEPNNKGVGQVCWGNCPATHKLCSEALCLVSGNFTTDCTPDTIEHLETTWEEVDFYLHTTPGNIAIPTALNVITGMHYDMCATVGSSRKRHIKFFA